MTPLDFAAKRDAQSRSWLRADPTEALIERVAWNRWLVFLLNGDDAHDQGECCHAVAIGNTTFYWSRSTR